MLIKINNLEQTKSLFIISDTHFGHSNILKYINRPFKNIEEHDEALVQNWNNQVGFNDKVIHLGDFTLGNSLVASNYFGKLNGNIAVLSNPAHHDKRWLTKVPEDGYYSKSEFRVSLLPGVVTIEVDLGGKFPEVIVLCHFPLNEWDRKHHNSVHCYGHSHNDLMKNSVAHKSVSVENIGYTPISLYNVLREFGRV